MRAKLWTATLVLLLTLAHLPAGRAAPAAAPTIYIVTNTNDSGANSLRWAINQANVDGDESLIIFDIPGSGVHTIQPLTPLPALVEDTTQICGHTQPGWAPATDTTPATIVVEIDGSLAGPGNGFTIVSANNWIAGLAINRFDWNGVAIFSFGGSSATYNAVFGNHIGTDPTGMVDLGNGYAGVSISLGAQNSLVGGISPESRNVISGNGWEGVGIHGENTTGNIVCGNYIGTTAKGTDPLGNALHGVRVYGGAHDNTVGGDETSMRNVISGNDRDGVYIAGDGTSGNVVAGNYIGTDVNDTADLGNSLSGVYITNGAQENTIGGDVTAGTQNIISGNDWCGVVISGTGTTSNTIAGNYIGTDVSGTLALGNGGTLALQRDSGILISSGAQHNTVGGTVAGARNVVSGNDGRGIIITGNGTMGNVVLGNYVGTDAGGTADLGNGTDGVLLSDGAHDNTIGGTTPGEGNRIGFNSYGVSIHDGETMHNTIAGNTIGTDANGTLDLGNDFGGVQCLGSQNVIGPDNVIANNNANGVWVVGSGATSNTITRNSIYANGNRGIKLEAGGNNDIAAPVIAAAYPGSVHIVGTACAGCTVEVFENSDTDGEGETFVGDDTADATGAFTVTVSALTKPYLTATATDAISDTSEFSAVFTYTVYSVFLPLVMNNYEPGSRW